MNAPAIEVDTAVAKTVTLYQALTPIQFEALLQSDWRLLVADGPEQKLFYPKLFRACAETVAQMFSQASGGYAYVVTFELPQQFLRFYSVETVAYEAQSAYRIPVTDLLALNRHMLGRVSLLAVYPDLNLVVEQQHKSC